MGANLRIKELKKGVVHRSLKGLVRNSLHSIKVETHNNVKRSVVDRSADQKSFLSSNNL